MDLHTVTIANRFPMTTNAPRTTRDRDLPAAAAFCAIAPVSIAMWVGFILWLVF